jgi:hypothetical protein
MAWQLKKNINDPSPFTKPPQLSNVLASKNLNNIFKWKVLTPDTKKRNDNNLGNKIIKNYQ